MENVDLLQKVLNQTIERMARQTAQHELEVANLNAQIILLQEQIENNSLTNEVSPSFVSEDNNSE